MKKQFSTLVFISFCFTLYQNVASAALNIEITQGVAEAMPIAVMDLESGVAAPKFQANQNQTNIMDVVRNDLRTSGRFSPVDPTLPNDAKSAKDVNVTYWQGLGAESLVTGEIQVVGPDRYNVSFELTDTYAAEKAESSKVEGEDLVIQTAEVGKLISKTYKNVHPRDFRALAHHISDIIYEQLTGVRGAFSTRIAYVLVKPMLRGGNLYTLEVADADGFNPKPLLESRQPIMSPSWSPDGKELAFVSFEKNQSEIYRINVATGKRKLISSFPGINGAPSWSPDGQSIALVLSKDGNPKVYILDLAFNDLTQVTKGVSIDTEPTWEPGGQSLLFTSNRGGRPQIYRVELATGKTERVTYKGTYNARPALTRDGKHLVMIHRDDNDQFHIASQNMRTGEVSILTKTDLDESPTLSPNGAMVLYGTFLDEKGVLGVVTIDGRGQLRFPARHGNVQEPAWSPFLS